MSDEFELPRRKVLGALGSVGVASAGAGLGTSAYFSDTESFENNRLTAGELDLRIDWQQTYDGPASGDVYGTAGRSFVNAHPDHDNNGEQSLDLSDIDEGEFADDSGVVKYSNNSANIQQYLTCETLENFQVPDDFDNGNRVQDHLIELSDVKPGDSGEITFSFHLCDNPGYVWLTGALDSDLENGQNEAEQDDGDGESTDDGATGAGSGELAEAIEVQAWYDLDCDNEFNDTEGEDLLDSVFEWGSLRDVMDDLSTEGTFIAPGPYVASGNDQSTGSAGSCRALGKVEGWGDDKDISDIKVDDFNGVGPDTDTSSTSGKFLGYKEPTNGTLEIYVLLRNDTTGNETVVKIFNIRDKNGVVADDKDRFEGAVFGEPYKFDFKTVPSVSFNGQTYESDADGICKVFIKAGQDTTKAYEVRDGVEECSFGEENLHPDNDRAISNIVFYYCPDGGSGGSQEVPLCFEPGNTYCIGFEWRVPDDVGNEIQSDEVMFDLGFYTEQCRHNENPAGPGSS